MKKIKMLAMLLLISIISFTSILSFSACDEKEEVKSISLNTENVNKVFEIGDEFSYTGLKVTAEYKNGEKKEIELTSCVISTPNMSTEGSKPVKVTYQKKQAVYNIQVNKKGNSNRPLGTEYKFEGEDSHVKLEGGSLGNLGTACESNLGASQTYVSNFNANLGAKISYKINATEETEADLVVSVCKRSVASVFTDVVGVFVNDEMLDVSTSVVPSITEGENEWVTFVDVNLGKINLVQGENIIYFTIIDDSVGVGYNFNYMSLYTQSVSLSFADFEEDVPEGTAYYFEAEEANSNGWDNGLTIDENVPSAHGGKVVRGIGENADKGFYFEFQLKAEETADFTLYLVMGIGGDLQVDNVFKFSMDSTEIPTGVTLTGSWEEYKEYKLISGSMQKGKHNLKFKVEDGCLANFDAIKIISTTDIIVSKDTPELNTYRYEAEKGDSNSWNDGTDWLWRSSDENASNGQYVCHIDNAGSEHSGEAWISYTFNSDSAKEATLAFGIATGVEIPSSAITVQLNGANVTPSINSISGEGWSSYIKVDFCKLVLVEGNNTVKIIFNQGAGGNLDYIELSTLATITDPIAA